MSAEIVNLRRARKDRQRTLKAGEAAANRALFGQSRTERDAEATARSRAIRHLDAHKLPAGHGEDT